MSSLSNKSAQEISELLDEYGIKHGPVVDSTRALYEKKLKEAMAKGKTVKPSPDKTYYREEEEEVTYVYRTPTRSDASGDRSSYSYLRSKPEYRGKDFVDETYTYDTLSKYTNSSLKSGQDTPKAPKPSRLCPLWVQLLFFLFLAIFLYIVFSNMETNESFKGLE